VAKIKITDLPQDAKVSAAEMKSVSGGFSLNPYWDRWSNIGAVMGQYGGGGRMAPSCTHAAPEGACDSEPNILISRKL